MLRIAKRIVSFVCLTAIGLGVIGPAHAILWDIDDVLSGSDGGFGFSGFHDASTGSVMSGTALGAITGSGALGTFDDATGNFDVTVQSDGGPTHLYGNLDFGLGFGYLDSASDLIVDFATPVGLLQDTVITFLSGDVCCNSGGDDPNSFVSTGADEALITLWGANGFSGGSYHNEGGPTTLGMDLRVHLTRASVPEPATIGLMSVGLLGMGFVRRLRRTGRRSCGVGAAA